MTTHAPRRLVFGVLAVATTFIATAAPANAAGITIKTAARAAEISVTDCPVAAGHACRAFLLEAHLKLSALGLEETSFDAIAYPAMSAGDGVINNGAPISEGTASTGTFTLATNGKTSKVKFTADLVCFSPPCAISGAYTFTLSIARNPMTSKLTVQVVTDTDTAPNCVTTKTDTAILHKAFKGIGTVKGNGSTKSAKVYLSGGDNNFFQGKFVVQKRSGSCPAEV